MNTEGRRVTFSRSALKAAAARGWTADDLMDAFNNPKAVYPSKQREGQWRVCNMTVCLVGWPVGDSSFAVISVFANGSVVPSAA